jgi:hypothetical protein
VRFTTRQLTAVFRLEDLDASLKWADSSPEPPALSMELREILNQMKNAMTRLHRVDPHLEFLITYIEPDRPTSAP